MEKKTTIHPVFLTTDQLEMLKKLVLPNVARNEVGELDLWPEDTDEMNASQIYRQCELAEHNGLSLAWVSVYDVTREYGGPEEGGWGYDHWSLRSTKPANSAEDITQLFNKTVYEVAAESGQLNHSTPRRLLTTHWVASALQNPETALSYVRLERFSRDSYTSIYVVIEITPGSEATLYKPMWC